MTSALGAALTPEMASALQHAHQAAAAAKPPAPASFDAATAKEIEALTAGIIPSDGTPGAKEAGVVHFIDRALATFDKDKREEYRKGMEQVQAARRSLFAASSSVASLTAEEVERLLRAIEKSDFFELLRTHTVLGFVGDPSYGGNRGKVGWAHIGFEDRMQFQPPFGYYDAEAAKEGKA